MPRRFWQVAAFALACLLGGDARAAPAFPNDLPYTASVNLGSLLKMVMTGYERPLQEQDLLIGALRGMLATLDPYSRYLSPEEMKPFLERTEGRSVGVGLSLGREGLNVVISAVEPGGPADAAGLYEGLVVRQAGDVVVARLRPGEAVDKTYAALQGEAGSTVALHWRDPVWGKQGVARLRRGVVESFQVFAFALPGPDTPGAPTVCLLRITHLSANTPGQVQAALAASHAKPCRGWVWDLRGNEGGDLDATRALLSHLRPKGQRLYVFQRGPEKNRTTIVSDGLAPRFPLPLAVLVDGKTASGAELIAQHLSTQLGVPLAGERTFGKGLVQQVHQLNNGGGFTLTVGRYFGLDDASVADGGLEPVLSFAWPAPTGASAAYDKAARGLLPLLKAPPGPTPPEGGEDFWDKAQRTLTLRGQPFDAADETARASLWRAMRVASFKRRHLPHHAQMTLMEEDPGLPVAGAVGHTLLAARREEVSLDTVVRQHRDFLGPGVSCQPLGQHPRCLLLAVALLSRRQLPHHAPLLQQTLATLAGNENTAPICLKLHRWLRDASPPGFWRDEALALPVIESALAARRADDADELLRPLLQEASASARVVYLGGVAGMIKEDAARVDDALLRLEKNNHQEDRVALLLMLAREALREDKPEEARRWFTSLPIPNLRADLRVEALSALWQYDLEQGRCAEALGWLGELVSPTLFADPIQREPFQQQRMEAALRCDDRPQARAAALELLRSDTPQRRQAAQKLLESLGKP